MSDDTNKRLAEIEARANAATPGPWESAYASAGSQYGTVTTEFFVRRPGDDWSLAADVCEPLGKDNCCISESNAAFIAAAREDVPWLVSEVRRLQVAYSSAITAADIVAARNQELEGRIAGVVKTADIIDARNQEAYERIAKLEAALGWLADNALSQNNREFARKALEVKP